MAKSSKKSNTSVASPKQVPLEPPFSSSHTPTFFENLAPKSLLWLSVGLVFLLGVFLFWGILTQKYYYLFQDISSDSTSQHYPQFLQIDRYLKTEGLPGWSFNQGLGQNLYPFWFDVFDWIIYLPFQKNIAGWFFYKEFLKILCIAFVFHQYLKLTNVNATVRVLGTLFLAFCGYVTLGSQWGIFSTEVLLLASLLFGLEKLLRQQQWQWLSVTFFLMGLLYPFWFFHYGLFAAAYVFIRVFGDAEAKIQQVVKPLFSLVGAALLGALASGVMLLPNIQQMLESPRASGEVSYADKLLGKGVFFTENITFYGTLILRFFSNDILGSGSNFKGWLNYMESPMYYMGLPCLLLFTQVFGFATKKQRLMYGVVLGLIVLALVLPFLRYTFWLYTGDYFRTFSFLIGVTLLLLSLKALQHIIEHQKVNYPILIGTLLFWYVLLFYPYSEAKILEPSVKNMTTFLLLAYAGLIATLGSKNANMAKYGLFILVVIELGFNANLTMVKRPLATAASMEGKVDYTDYTLDAIQDLKKEDATFFRCDKDLSVNFNDAKAQDYFGTESYNSFNQKYHIKFLNEMGLIQSELDTRWAEGFTNAPLLQGLLSVKYLMSRYPQNSSAMWASIGFDSLRAYPLVRVYKNRNALPFGFCYDSFILHDDFKKLKPYERQIALTKGVVLEAGQPEKMPLLSKINVSTIDSTQFGGVEKWSSRFDSLRKTAWQMTKFSHNNFEGQITLTKPQLLFFSTPYDQGWTATIDGVPTKPELVNVGFMGVYLPQGKHTVAMTYEPPYRQTGGYLSLVGLALIMALSWKERRAKSTEGLR